MADIRSQPVPSLIQGISQQEITSRSQSSAADQQNCMNSVLDGVVARNGGKVIAAKSPILSDPFCHVIDRGDGERYVLVVDASSLYIFNLDTGVDATITGSIAAYLAHSGAARKAFSAVTVEDTTFLTNNQKTVAMAPTTSAARANEAMFHVKAGSYKTTYTLSLIPGNGNTYSASYTTPDNSTPGNAAFITTENIAKEMKDALTATIFPAMVSDGVTGFSAIVTGSTCRITGGSSWPNFDIDTHDGQGDKQFISFKERVRSFTDLPVRAFNGYQVIVAGDKDKEQDDFHLKFVGSSTTGQWEEVVKPGTKTTLSGLTMPHEIINTGLNAFTVQTATWGLRLAGDGVLTAQDPSFVGKKILDTPYIAGRLGVVTKASLTLSRARNAYVFFPDTVRAKLDTAPVDYAIANGKVTVVKRGVVAGGSLQLWAGTSQLALSSGQDPIREDTTEVKPMADYKFDGECSPEPVGLNSLMFGSKVGAWNRIRQVFFQDGVATGEIDITGHCPRLVKGRMAGIEVGETEAVFRTDDDPRRMYFYQWYNNGDERVQSAWNPWTFSAPSKVVWAGIIDGEMFLLHAWANCTTLEKITLSPSGDEPEQRFALRLDHRISEASSVYSSGGYTITLPYEVQLEKRDLFVCLEREDNSEVTQRGAALQFEWLSSTSVRFEDERTNLKFYFGAVPESYRTFSTLHIADDRGPILPDRLVIKSVRQFHDQTAEYSVVFTKANGDVVEQTYEGRVLGDPSVTNEQVPIKSGVFQADIGEPANEVTIKLANNTPYPSRWSSMEFLYEVTKRPSR